MRKIMALAIASVTFGAESQARIDPSKYTQTITVESASIQHKTTGATVHNSTPSVLHPDGGARIDQTGFSYADVIFVLGDSRYEVTRPYGLVLEPGEYKMKFNNDQWVEILVPNKEGKFKSCRYKIAAVEKISKEPVQH
jgi:hypothetical protein